MMWSLTSTETIRLIRDGDWEGDGEGGGGMEVGPGLRESIYTYRYIVTTRMTYIKMGSDESQF